MPPTPEPTATELLITEAFAKRASIALLEIDLTLLESRIIQLGKGKHRGVEPAHTLTVVAAVPASTGAVSYDLDADNESVARNLAGDHFGKFFKRIVSFLPIEGFAAVVPTHLTPAKARDLVKLCEVPGKPNSGKRAYILWK